MFANVPDCVTLQTNLQTLNMEYNQVKHIGPEFFGLQKLRLLNLSKVTIDKGLLYKWASIYM